MQTQNDVGEITTDLNKTGSCDEARIAEEIAAKSAEIKQSDEIENSSALSQRLAAIESALIEIRELIQQRLQYDRVKEDAFKMLSKRIEETTPVFHRLLKKDLLKSMLNFYDHIKDAEERYPLHTLERVQIAGLRQELLDRLEMEDVELIEASADKFDNNTQKAIKSVPTFSPEEDRTIAKVIQDGFCQDGKVIRPQCVVVRRFQVEETSNDTKIEEDVVELEK